MAQVSKHMNRIRVSVWIMRAMDGLLSSVQELIDSKITNKANTGG